MELVNNFNYLESIIDMKITLKQLKKIIKEEIQGKYKYRNLPCNISNWQPWSVAGHDTILGGGGVLEWCYDEADAQDRFQKMSLFAQFKNLKICKP